VQTTNHAVKKTIENERNEILGLLEDWLETPMLVLGFVWLLLLVLELTTGLSEFLETVGTIIWIIFILDFAIKFTLAPHKLTYLKKNWLTAIALVVPALRVFRLLRVVRLLRVARAARGLRLVRVVTSVNRGMKALGATMGRRGMGYIVALTMVVTVSGAAAMYAFENDISGGFNSYGAALWWTAMLITSIGSEYWPQSAEGRALCFLISLYGFAVFGYVTATLTSFFIGRDAENQDGEIAGTESVKELRDEIAALRADIEVLLSRKPAGE
jgi:voltage-gated potassium channel